MGESPTPPLNFGPDGLVPVVVQDAASGDVLMVAFMNEAALAATRATGRAHYWSRGRGRLWRKGETSGHEQIVEEIYVNCEQNSLLLRVRQLGAVCHDGYPTCYYRRLEPDDHLTIVRQRVFDPAAVYGGSPTNDRISGPTDPLAIATRTLYGAYAFLRDNDLAAVSATSGRLRATADDVGPRVADELMELAGVLDGSHRHADPRSDLLLEGTQALYWLIVAALRASVSWADLRPDRALATHDDDLEPATAARLLRAEADRWAAAGSADPDPDLAARCHATIALVAQACRCGGVSPLELIESDLQALRAKPYLAPYFADAAADDRSAAG